MTPEEAAAPSQSEPESSSSSDADSITGAEGPPARRGRDVVPPPSEEEPDVERRLEEGKGSVMVSFGTMKLSGNEE